jgi:hypothetical protein
VTARALACALLIGLCALAPRPATALEIALYDPDANLADAAKLRSVIGAFVRTIAAGAGFQPFRRIRDLERHLSERRVEFVLLNSKFVGRLAHLGLRPVLVPLRDGKASYHKVLVVRRGTDPAAIRVVATTSSTDEVHAIALGDATLGEQRVLVLNVSKGIDAVLGMAFRRADAAYVTPDTLAQLARVDAELAASLLEIYRSPPIPNPMLYVVGKVPDDVVARVVGAFTAMNQTPGGRAALEVLGFSGWRAP